MPVAFFIHRDDSDSHGGGRMVYHPDCLVRGKGSLFSETDCSRDEQVSFALQSAWMGSMVFELNRAVVQSGYFK